MAEKPGSSQSQKGAIQKKLDAKLLAYCAVASGALLAAPPAEASVIYSGVKNRSLNHSYYSYPCICYGGRTSLDMDGNGKADAVFVTSNYYNRAAFLQGSFIGSHAQVSKLPNGSLIGPGQQWAVFSISSGSYGGGGGGAVLNNGARSPFGFFGNTQGYIGLKFSIGAEKHYGWIQYSGDYFTICHHSNAGGTIIDWAYESTPDTPIIAGDTGPLTTTTSVAPTTSTTSSIPQTTTSTTIENSAPLIVTVAGNYNLGGGFSGDGGAATAAKLHLPMGVSCDSSGNIYIADYYNNRVRKVNTSGVISTVAGYSTGGYSGDGGPATAAKCSPYGITADSAGNLYISEYGDNRIRKVDAAGIITTIAGTGSAGYSGDGGAATAAKLSFPYGVVLDSSGNIYIADESNHRIRKVDTSGIISTFAGNGIASYSGDGGQATAANLYCPQGVALDSSGNLYIADTCNSRIRMVNTSGIISTIAGNGMRGYAGDGGAATAAKLNEPYGVVLDSSGNIYISDESNYRIRKVNTSGVISTVAGNGSSGYSGDGGPATAAKLNAPVGLGVNSSGNLIFADCINNVIREVIMSGGLTTTTTASIPASTTTTAPVDTDLDGIPDSNDNCPGAYNPDQKDANGNGTGDCCDLTPGCGGCGQPACDTLCGVDTDGDGISDSFDNCASVYNPNQKDANKDGIGDCCDQTPGCGGCGQPACDTVCTHP